MIRQSARIELQDMVNQLTLLIHTTREPSLNKLHEHLMFFLRVWMNEADFSHHLQCGSILPSFNNFTEMLTHSSRSWDIVADFLDLLQLSRCLATSAAIYRLLLSPERDILRRAVHHLSRAAQATHSRLHIMLQKERWIYPITMQGWMDNGAFVPSLNIFKRRLMDFLRWWECVLPSQTESNVGSPS